MQIAANPSTTISTAYDAATLRPIKSYNTPLSTEERNQFIANLGNMFGMVASYLGTDNFTEFQYEYCQRLFGVFLLTEEFAQMSKENKKRMIDYHESMMFLMAQFGEFFDKNDYKEYPNRFYSIFQKM